MPKQTFIIFCTTDYELVLDTIKSRSLEIKLELVPHDEAYKNIYEVCSKFNIPMDDEVAERIIQIGRGHMRTVHQNISKYELLGRENYLSLFNSSTRVIEDYFRSIAQRNKENCFKSIDELLQYPLVNIRDDFDTYILNLTKSLVTTPNEVVKLLGANTLKLIKLVLSDWFKDCFSSDVELQTGLLCVYQIMSESVSQQRPTQTNINARR